MIAAEGYAAELHVRLMTTAWVACYLLVPYTGLHVIAPSVVLLHVRSSASLPHHLRHAVSCAEDPLVGSIAQQLLQDKEQHDKTAAEWTRRYAQG